MICRKGGLPDFKFLCWTIGLCLLVLPLSGQNRTVGVFLNDSLALNGYTLFAPTSSTRTYLIDNCGYIVNSWGSNFRPGLSVYLLEDGSLLRPCRISSEFNAGGTGGRIEKYSWEGDLIWGHNLSNDTVHQHHDVAPLPNGNVLILAWDKKTREAAEMQGRNPALIMGNSLWAEKVVEWKIEAGSEPEIVWEWRVWDHLVQNFDSEKNNYGVVAEHPELFDLNYVSGIGEDWLHANSIDYNSDLDQIVVNSRNWGEFWVIDHSTTTEEAAGNSGGNSNKGGDILYRWGNPRTYDRGSPYDQKLFGQHNVAWIPKGFPGEGNILIFNNGLNRPEGAYTTVDEIIPPITSTGEYLIEEDAAYGPEDLLWSFPEVGDFEFYAPRVSGAQRLSNGNTLICDGTDGRFFEVTAEMEKVWDYVCPVAQGNAITQGNPANGNDAFRVTRYPVDYLAFENRDLEPSRVIELNPLPDSCQLFDGNSVGIAEAKILEGIQCFPNPVENQLYLDNQTNNEIHVQILNASGKEIQQLDNGDPQLRISTQDWPKGIYFIRVINKEQSKFFIQKIIKQ